MRQAHTKQQGYWEVWGGAGMCAERVCIESATSAIICFVYSWRKVSSGGNLLHFWAPAVETTMKLTEPSW